VLQPLYACRPRPTSAAGCYTLGGVDLAVDLVVIAIDRRPIASLRGAGAIQVGLRSGDSVAGPLEPLTSAVNRGLSAVQQVWGLTEGSRAPVQPGVPLDKNLFGLVLPLFAVVGALVSLVRRGVATVGQAVALVGRAVALIRDASRLSPTLSR